MAKNGRSLEFPWSRRQSAIYESYEAETDRRVWLVIQPSEAMEAQILHRFDQRATLSDRRDSVNFHVSGFLATETTWREYMNALEVDLTKLVGRDVNRFTD